MNSETVAQVLVLWPTFVKEQFAHGVSLVVGALLILAAGIVVCVLFQKRAPHAHDDDCACTYAAFSWIILFSSIIATIFLLTDAIPYIVAPEPKALREIANTIRYFK